MDTSFSSSHGHSTHSAEIFDHYPGGFDAPPESPSLSTGDVHSPGNAQEGVFGVRRSLNPAAIYSSRRPSHDVGSALGSPHPSQGSRRSSLSSLHKMLKAGVFPPGMHANRRSDSDSDASHYDDEDVNEFMAAGGGPFGIMPASLNAAYLQENDEIFSNAQDAPFVPRRVSSADSKHSISPLKKSLGMTSADGSFSGMNASRSGKDTDLVDAEAVEEALGRARGSGSTASRVVSPSQSPKTTIVDPIFRDKTPSPPSAHASAAPKDVVPEVQPATIDDEDLDPNRPKTLKEARQLAKERARVRLQAKESYETPASQPSSSKTISVERPMRSPQRQSFQSDGSADFSSVSREGRGGTTADSADWRGHSRQRAFPVTPGEEEEEEGRVLAMADDNGKVRAARPVTASIAMAMEELEAAVGDAIQDVSFSSSTTTNATVHPAVGPPLLPASTLDLPVRGEGDNHSSTRSASSFDSARESIPLSSAAASANIPIWSSTELTKSPLRKTVALSFTESPEVDKNATSAAAFVPHTLHTQQRSPVPNKIARLDIYGKTVPWPPAFNPAAIIEQRKLAPWERARSYAHYCNDLTRTKSGLSVWMEMVQRPAQRVYEEPTTPVKRHPQGEGTDHSGYAASVRSDATFPVRGDGGRAKEISSNLPATINESPPNVLPTNIPYPMLVQPPSRGSTSSLDDGLSSSSSVGLSERDRSLGLQRSGNFFTSLGRKTSTRRTPGSSSMSSFSPLSMGNTSGGQIRSGMRGIGKAFPNNSGATLNSSPSLASVNSSNQAITPTEETSSPSPQLNTSGSTFFSSGKVPSSPTKKNSNSSGRMPMGPRAPTATGLPFSKARRQSLISLDKERSIPYGLIASGGSANSANYNISPPTTSIIPPPTDYSTSNQAAKSSLAYTSVRGNRSPLLGMASLQPHAPSIPRRQSSESGKRSNSSRRGSQQSVQATAAENEAVDKLADVLPDADRSTLLDHLRKAGGNDLVAIGDYLQTQAKNNGPRQY